jgi:cytochrome oxidase assembly protein ShyY1
MTFTPAQHLERAEHIIEELATRQEHAETNAGVPWPRHHLIELAGLHLQAAATRAQLRATLLIPDETGENPWEPPNPLKSV